MKKIKMSKNKIILLSILLIVIVSFISNDANAQNFANYTPNQNIDEDNLQWEVPDEVIEQLLALENQDTIEGNEKTDEYTKSKYSLGPNDILKITVMRHPEVSGEFIINSEGKIQYEFVGDIKISGKTKEEAKEILVEKLSKYIILPEVMIKILGYNSKVVYVVGEVARPGKIFMRGDTITVREALIQSGLPLLSAKAEKSKLITPADKGKAKQKKVNVHKLLYKGDLRENLVMRPGDTLYVPPTIMAKTLRILQPVAAPISTAAGTGRTITTGF